jgi:hypothetical protein
MNTLTDWELWAVANEVMQQHGERASVHIAERIGALALAGNGPGVEAWKAVAVRVQSLGPDAAVRLH